MGLRKTPAVLVAFGAAAALAIAGCSSSSSSTSTSTTTSSAPAQLTVWRMGGSVASEVTWMNGVIAEFIFALTFLGTDTAKFTLPIYVQYFYGRNGADWGAIMAASTLFTIPVMAFFLLVQRRRLAAGMLAGAVKG